MKRISLFILSALLILLGLGLAGLAARKTVTLMVDGKSRAITTFALTVGEFLRQQGVAAGPADQLQPRREGWLRDGETVRLERAAQVLVRADGKTIRLLSPERIPANLLSLASIPLYPGDRLMVEGVLVDPEDPLGVAPSHSLSVWRAVPVRLREMTPEGEREHRFTSAAATLGQALWEAGIRMYIADHMSPPAETPLSIAPTGDAIEAVLIRSRELTIRADGRRLRVRSAAATVGEALAGVGLALQWLDASRPAEDAPLPSDGRVRVIRVRESVTVEQSPLPFETEYQADPALEIDQQSILKTGEYGLLARRVRVRYEDGEEVSRRVDGEWMARPAHNRVIGYGTKIVMHTLKTKEGVIQYWRALRMWATSYSPASAGGDTTASGKKLRKGLVGVDRNLIPFGTLMYVPGYGPAEAADTGAISGRWIDLGYSNEDYVPWHEWVVVYFLWPPPANPVWIFP